MPNLRIRELANFKILAAAFVSATFAPAIRAQATPQLQIEAGPNQQISMLAKEVSYGEVLRALQRKVGWEIEIPALADELKLAYVRVEAAQPRMALARLLEGSRLGYALVEPVEGSLTVRVVVIPSIPRGAMVAHDAAWPNPAKTAAETSLASPTQAQVAKATQPNVTTAETTPQKAEAPLTMLLADAIKAIGVPPGVSASDVGGTITLPISDAERNMSAPQGVVPGDVGKTMTLPLPTGPGQHP